jgi:hypothetical protein
MPGGPGRGPGEMGRPDGPQGPRGGDWLKGLDTNKNGSLDNDELQSALERTFAQIDRDGNGVIEGDEAPLGPPPMGGRPDGGMSGRPDGRMGGQPHPEGGMDRGDDKRLLPPFFFERRLHEGSTTRQQFAEAVRGVFNEMDKDHSGSLSREEARPPKHDGPGGGPGAPPPPPNARFIGAELRFGDKLVEGHPFSAETVIEDTRRLYDGSTVTKSVSGAIYRNTAGSTRREQPLEMIGGVQVGGSDGKPQTLVFINDFANRTQTFLDANNKTARTHTIGDGPRPEGPGGPAARSGEKTESLGTKTIDGVKVEGTRITFEIPAGHLGNDKPIEVVTENWFSPELGVMVMSRHIDPIAGEHVFRLTNIKLGEPSADLFTVPQGYKLETDPDRRPHEE